LFSSDQGGQRFKVGDQINIVERLYLIGLWMMELTEKRKNKTDLIFSTMTVD